MGKSMVLTILLLLPALLFAQTAAEMDALMEAETVSAAKAARFVLGAADLLPRGVSGAAAERAAYEMASSNGWIKRPENESVTLKETAFLVFRAFDLKGGFLCRITKNARYAYREMIFLGLIQGRTDQKMKVSGERLLLILDQTMAYADGSAW